MSTCDADGHWGNAVPCEGNTPVCDNDGKICVSNGSAGECTPNETKCESNAMSTCDADGHWGTAVPCEDATPVCDNDGKICVAESQGDTCEVGQNKCNSEHNAVLSCKSDGTWDLDTPSQCQFDSVCSDETNKCECSPGTKYCGGAGKGQGIYICGDDKEYKFDVATGTCVCKADHSGCEESGSCEVGTHKCSDDHSAVLTCSSDGDWDVKNPLKCDKHYTCKDDTQKCQCEPGAEICTLIDSDSEGMYKCNDDGTTTLIKWCICNEDQTACADSGDACKEDGARKCDGQTPKVCKGGVWTESGDECKRNEYCNEEAGAVCIPRFINKGVCDESETVCNGTQLMQCENGLYNKVAYPECHDGLCHRYFCITSSLAEGAHKAEYSEKCSNTSYCDDNIQYSCGLDGTITNSPCGGKSDKCILTTGATIAPIATVCAVPKCNEHEFYCEEDSLSYCFNGKKVKLADCSIYDLACSEGANGGCVAK